MKVEEIKSMIEKREINLTRQNLFSRTNKIGNYIEFDDNNELWFIPNSLLGISKNTKIYEYTDIIEFDLLEDGESVTSGGVGSALVGGILSGGIGALIGGVTSKKKNKGFCNSLRLKIVVKDRDNPVVFIDFINTSTKKNSFNYKMIYDESLKCMGYLKNIVDNFKKDITQNIDLSAADEILKFKELMDKGIITEEEFNKKKKQLLDSGYNNFNEL